jgi:hypothetical protein
MNDYWIPDLAYQFVEFARGLKKERREFYLLALVLREGGSPEVWDVVASASWLSPSSKADTEWLIDEIKKKIGLHVLSSIARVVILPQTPFVASIVKQYVQKENRSSSPLILTGDDLQRHGLGFEAEYGIVVAASIAPKRAEAVPTRRATNSRAR